FFLLHDYPITEKNIQHCLEIKKENQCDCAIHKGIRQVYFFDSWIVGEGKLSNLPYCIDARRKDYVFPQLLGKILSEYDISEKELKAKYFYRELCILK